MSSLSAKRLRTSVLGLGLFAASAGFTLWQNAHVAVLWDLSYLLDSAWRFSLGQIPYRDFPFAHAPLTFLIQAIGIRLFGRVFWHVIAYAAAANGLATLLTWRIALRLWPAHRRQAAWLCATLVPLGIYSIYPHPIYDADCILSVLLAIYLALSAGPSLRRNALAGVACVLPLFFKQNIGLFFYTAMLAAGLAQLTAAWRRKNPLAPHLAFLVNMGLATALALLILHFTVGLQNYRYWTLTFAAQRRLPGLGLLLDIYRQSSLLWTLPTSLLAVALLLFLRQRRGVTLCAALLLIAPFACAAITFFLADDPSDRTDALLSLWPHLLLLSGLFAVGQLRQRVTLPSLLPLVLLSTIHGAFLSQQLWGSTYALWPLLVLLLVLMLRTLPISTTGITFTVGAIFLICGSFYALGHDRLSYIHRDGTVSAADLPPLQGMRAPGPWIPEFEQLVRSTNSLIPQGDGILLIPGQDPFYYATGRVPQFPVLLLDPATNPFSPLQMRDEARRRNIRWLIVNRQLQLAADPVPDLSAYVDALTPGFTLAETLPNYLIYRRKNP